VEQTYANALALCDESTDPSERYPMLRGLGTNYLVRGRIVQADALALQCVELAERTARPDLLIDAHSFAAYPALYRGRLADAQRALDPSLALYASEHGERFGYPTAQDPGTAAWSLLTTVAWLRGELHAADAAARSLEAHLERLSRPFDTTFGQVWLAGSCQLQRRFAAAVEHAQAGLEIAHKHGFGTWIPAATMQICIGHGALAASPESIATLRYVHGEFLRAGAEVSATFYLWGIAQALIVAGEREAARGVVQEGLARVELGEETYMKAELLMQLAQLEDGPARAAGHLHAALQDAQRQGATMVALRAACRLLLADGRASTKAAERARAALSVLDGESACGPEADWAARTLEAAMLALPAG
jgi:hypothetical protein